MPAVLSIQDSRAFRVLEPWVTTGNLAAKAGRLDVCSCCSCWTIWSFFSNSWGEITPELLVWLPEWGSMGLGCEDGSLPWTWCPSGWAGREPLKYPACAWACPFIGAPGVAAGKVALRFGTAELAGAAVLGSYLVAGLGPLWSFSNRLWVLEALCTRWEVATLCVDPGCTGPRKTSPAERVLPFLQGRFSGSSDNGWRSALRTMSFWMAGHSCFSRVGECLLGSS